MKILAVTVQYPFPPMTGSSIVAYSHLQYLSQNHDIKLICFAPPKREQASEKFLKEVELIQPTKKSKLIKYLNYFINILIGIPVAVSAHKSKEMELAVKNSLLKENYDAILLFEISTIQYCPKSHYKIAIVNAEDPQSIKLKRLSQLKIYPRSQRIKYFITSVITSIYENRVFPKIGKVLLLSNQDIADVNKKNKYKNIAYVPYGVDLVNNQDIVGYPERKRVMIFSGNMYYPPNVDGALFILNDIFPIVFKLDASIILWIVGSSPDERIYQAAKKFGNNIIITGRVENMSDYIKTAAISICPIRLKVGVQTKILEALAWGTPVITTEIGNSGIAGISGHNLLTAKKPREFAEKIVATINGSGWKELSVNGKKLAEDLFSWNKSGLMLETYIKELSNKK